MQFSHFSWMSNPRPDTPMSTSIFVLMSTFSRPIWSIHSARFVPWINSYSRDNVASPFFINPRKLAKLGCRTWLSSENKTRIRTSCHRYLSRIDLASWDREYNHDIRRSCLYSTWPVLVGLVWNRIFLWFGENSSCWSAIRSWFLFQEYSNTCWCLLWWVGNEKFIVENQWHEKRKVLFPFFKFDKVVSLKKGNFRNLYQCMWQWKIVDEIDLDFKLFISFL